MFESIQAIDRITFNEQFGRSQGQPCDDALMASVSTVPPHPAPHGLGLPLIGSIRTSLNGRLRFEPFHPGQALGEVAKCMMFVEGQRVEKGLAIWGAIGHALIGSDQGPQSRLGQLPQQNIAVAFGEFLPLPQIERAGFRFHLAPPLSGGFVDLMGVRS